MLSFRSPLFLRLLIACLGCTAIPALVQGAATLTCTPSGVTPLLHAEGVSEQLGDIVIDCVGGTPGSSTAGNLSIFLNTTDTNKITPSNNLDVNLTIDAGSGPVSPGIPAQLVGTNQVVFDGVPIVVPATGHVILRINNLRGSANLIPPSNFAQVQANLSFTGNILTIVNSTVSIGTVAPSLLSSVQNTVVGSQQGSLLPDTISFSGLLAFGTRFSSARITENQAAALQPRQPMADNGVRILSRYSNLPAGARVFVPDVVAGSDAASPTVGGHFGGTASGGKYLPGSRTLLLSLVRGTDTNGAGGSLAFTPPAGGSPAASFDSVSELQVSGGTALAVYEVVDANPAAIESAQIPTFFGIAPVSDAQIIQVGQALTLGPISTVATASAGAPVPRFVATSFASDCTVQADCNGAFLPRLGVDPDPFQLTEVSGGGFDIRYVRIFNNGGGVLVWNAIITYQSGSNWLRVSPASGIGNARTRVDILAANLAPGNYQATLTIDAGPGGQANIPINLQVTAPPTQVQVPTITTVINAASFATGPLVRGSLATIKGTNLTGSNLTVTFDGIAASILFSSANQINLQVPASLGARSVSQLVVAVNGNSSAPQTVQLANANPAVFVPGILNQDNTVNSASNPALTGSVVQVYATGLLPPEGGKVDVQIGNDAGIQPLYADQAPTIPGVQQVNVTVPDDLPAGANNLILCNITGGGRVCSPSVTVTVRK